MDALAVLAPGAFTTVQDSGRFGFQHMGLPVSGALDQFSYQVANMLVGNPRKSAVLELTVMGPRLEILCDADIAITGATMGMTLNGDQQPAWKTIRVKTGDLLEIHQVTGGCRAYLAITGGIDVPLVMGSRSTYVGAGIGGYKGRALQSGDLVCRGNQPPVPIIGRLSKKLIPEYPSQIELRAIVGPQNEFFSDGLTMLFNSEFMVTPKADRMGYRLQGPRIKRLTGMPQSIISEPSVAGGIQIPADEQPIVLLVEQTVGGYTKIATVISTDLPRLAQATPGDTIRFREVDLETAHKLLRERKEMLLHIEETLSKGNG